MRVNFIFIKMGMQPKNQYYKNQQKKELKKKEK